MDDDDLSYLQPDFNPASLTVAKLRNILLKHGIAWSSATKKGDLVDIFNDKLKPKAKRILNAQKRVQRTSLGIENAAATAVHEEDSDEEEEEVEPPPPASPVKRRGRPRKTEKAPEEEEIDQAPAPPPTIKKSRSRPAKSRERERDRRTPSATTPGVKKEDSDPTTWRHYGKDSPFSAENPFQSGSSPPPATSTTKRRKTDGAISDTDKRNGISSSRRRTDNPSVVKRTSTVVNVPIASDEVEAGEEFEESEQIELELERRSGNTAVAPVRRTRRSKGSAPIVPGILSTLLVLFSAFAYFWAGEKRKVGYCHTGPPSHTNAIAGIEIPIWADFLRPECEVCPQHAICHGNLETYCEKGFVLNQHPLSLGGLLPLVPTCEADAEAPKRVKAVASRIVNELRETKAQADCTGIDNQGNPVGSDEVDEETLREKFNAKKPKKFSDEEWNEMFADGLSEAEGREEVTVVEVNGRRLFKSSSTAKYPITCAIRKSLVTTLSQYSRSLMILLSAVIGTLSLYYKLQSDRATTTEAKRLATRVFAELTDIASADDDFVSITQLRDSVLRDEFSSARRKKVWGKVEQLVEQNSNVRTKVGAVSSGGVGRGWRWIGSEGAGSSRRQSGVGHRKYDSSSPGMEEASTPSHVSDISEFKRWGDEPQF